jgi:hypothetical protein
VLKKTRTTTALLTSIFLAFLVFGFIFFFSERKTESNPSSGAHFYKDPSQDISKIDLKVFYAIPKNRVTEIVNNWQKIIDNALEKGKRFHAFQFRGKSELNYEIFPEPIILSKENYFYDTAKTDKGNPQALISIIGEIERRVFNQSGDLYQANFSFNKNAYPVIGIIYEGVGASGGVILESAKENVEEIANELKISPSHIFITDIAFARGFFLLARQFLTDEKYSFFGPSLLYHEFAHSFGLPDFYDPETNIVFSNDIMGAGRRRPIESAFIDRSLLIDLGVLDKK